MKFALIGLDPYLLALVRAIQQSKQHQLVAAYDLGPADREALAGVLDPLQMGDAWEELLHATTADAVLIAAQPGDEEVARERRTEQLRKLAPTNLQLVLVQPACEALVGYELEMIREDSSAPLVPLLPYVSAQMLAYFKDLIERGDEGPIGRVEQIAIERSFPDRDPQRLRCELSRDAALLRAVAGDIRKVGALGDALTPGGAFHLSATMQAANGILCRWSISVLGESNDARLTLLGTKGQLVATRNRTDETWIAGGAVQETFRGNEAAAEALAEIERVASSQPPVFSWREASRGQEVAEAIERSALRGKTVELFNEEHTEQGTFKGMMAVGSCGLLMLTLLILVVGAFIESVRLPLMRMQQRAESAEQLGGPNELGAERVPPVANEPFPLWIRLWPVYPLALFLALQLINVLFIRPAMQRKERQDHRESRG